MATSRSLLSGDVDVVGPLGGLCRAFTPLANPPRRLRQHSSTPHLPGGKSRVIVACHFGEWIQGRLGPEGPVVLVTLIPAGRGVRAWVRPGTGLTCRSVGHGGVASGVLRRFARAIDPKMQGRVTLHLPYPPGLGTGMSTAALVALAHALRPGFTPEALAAACLRAEGASDPLMLAHPGRWLWASRRGQALAALPTPPRAELLAGFWGPPRPTDPGDLAYADVADLLRDWAKAPGLHRCAALASESARRCMGLRGPADDPTAQLACDLGALGWVMSHSGAARALVFAPGTAPAHGLSALREAGLHGVHRLATNGA